MKAWQKLLLFLIVLAGIGFGVWKLGTRPAPVVVSKAAPATSAATATDSTPAKPVRPAVKAPDNVPPVAADRKTQVLADTKKLAALDVQVERLTVGALGVYNANYGKDREQGTTALKQILADATAAKGQLDQLSGLAPEVKSYQENLTAAVTAKVTMIEKWIEGLNGDKSAVHEAAKLGEAATAATDKADQDLAVLAAGLGVKVESLIGN